MIISPNMAIQGCILAGGNGCKPVFPIAPISATSLGIAKKLVEKGGLSRLSPEPMSFL